MLRNDDPASVPHKQQRRGALLVRQLAGGIKWKSICCLFSCLEISARAQLILLFHCTPFSSFGLVRVLENAPLFYVGPLAQNIQGPWSTQLHPPQGKLLWQSAQGPLISSLSAKQRNCLILLCPPQSGNAHVIIIPFFCSLVLGRV